MMSRSHSLLVLGGARSGKSRYAQGRAEAFAGDPVFIATGEPFDAEMADRIARHQADRGARWRTVEAPLPLAAAIFAEAGRDRVLLVDCLTIWTANLLHAERDVAAEAAGLAAAVTAAAGTVILVSNEVGLGIVPDNALARRFRDAAGTVNQTIAAAATEVVFVAAGLPMTVK